MNDIDEGNVTCPTDCENIDLTYLNSSDDKKMQPIKLITYRQNLNKTSNKTVLEVSPNKIFTSDTVEEFSTPYNNGNKVTSNISKNDATKDIHIISTESTNCDDNHASFNYSVASTFKKQHMSYSNSPIKDTSQIILDVDSKHAIDISTSTNSEIFPNPNNINIPSISSNVEINYGLHSKYLDDISSTKNNEMANYIKNIPFVEISPYNSSKTDAILIGKIDDELSPAKTPDSSSCRLNLETVDRSQSYFPLFNNHQNISCNNLISRNNDLNNFLLSGAFGTQAANFAAFSGQNLWKNLQQINKEVSSENAFPTKIKCTPAREAVDPAKYFTLTGEPDGVKYACSKCGNVYKWRKSLNKHWKEKHEGEKPPNQIIREQMMRIQSQLTSKSNNFTNKQIVHMNSNNPISEYNKASKLHTMSFNSSALPWATFNSQQVIFKNKNLFGGSIFHQENNYSNENNTALDLSIKEDSFYKNIYNQDLPIDFSTKSSRVEMKTQISQQRKCGSTQTTRCIQCKLYFSTLTDLNKHFKMHHKDKIHQLLLHAGKHDKGQSISNVCIVCGFECLRAEDINSHLIKTHSISIGSENDYASEENNILVSTCTNLQNDLETTVAFSNALKWFGCDTKDFNRDLITDLSKDLSQDIISDISTSFGNEFNNSLISDLSKDGTAYVIPEAPEETNLRQNVLKIGKSKKELLGNLPEHLLPFKCRLCAYRARWPSEMTQHMKNHSDEKPYQCPQCQYRSKWKWDVVKHLKRCSDKEELKRRKFNLFSFTNLSSHKSDDYTFESESSMSKTDVDVGKLERVDGDGEINSTSADNTLECVLCSFKGHSSAELKRHMRVHCDEKPYSCKTCRYSSKWKCDLKKHIRAYNHLPAHPLTYRRHSRKHYTYNKMYQQNESDLEGSYELTEFGRMKCTLCAYETQEVTAIIHHQRSHDIKEQDNDNLVNMGCANKLDEIDNVSSCTDILKNMTKGDFFLKNLGLKRKCEGFDSLPENLSIVKKYTFPILKFRRGRQGLTTTEGAEEGLSKRKRKLRSCEKCGYITDNLTTLQRHAAKHGGTGRHSCQLCDYTVDRQHVLDYHIDIVHDRRRSNTIDKRSSFLSLQNKSSFNENFSNSYDEINNCNYNNQDSCIDSLNLDKSIDNINSFNVTSDRISQTEIQEQELVDGNDDLDHQIILKPISSNYCGENKVFEENKLVEFNIYTNDDLTDHNCNKVVRKGERLKKVCGQVLNVRGVKIRIIVKDGNLCYLCIKCSFSSKDANRTIFHGRQHFRQMARFRCKICNFSTNQIYFHFKHLMQMHCITTVIRGKYFIADFCSTQLPNSLNENQYLHIEKKYNNVESFDDKKFRFRNNRGSYTSNEIDMGFTSNKIINRMNIKPLNIRDIFRCLQQIGGAYFCHKCHFISINRNLMKRHKLCSSCSISGKSYFKT